MRKKKRIVLGEGLIEIDEYSKCLRLLDPLRHLLLEIKPPKDSEYVDKTVYRLVAEVLPTRER